MVGHADRQKVVEPQSAPRDGLVAVIMSVYRNDRPEFVRLAVDSLLNQTYRNLKVMICGDGEIQPETQLFIEQASTLDSRVTFYPRKENRGLAFSLNEMIERSLELGPEYIARMDADDISAPNRIERQVSILEQIKELDVLGTACIEFTGAKEFDPTRIIRKPLTDEELKKRLIVRSPFVHPSVLFRRSVFQKGARYPVQFHLSEDLAFWALLAGQGAKFGNLDEPLLWYRMTDDVLRRRRSVKKAFAELKIRISICFRLPGQMRLANLAWSFAYFALRLSPHWASKLLYKKLR